MKQLVVGGLLLSLISCGKSSSDDDAATTATTAEAVASTLNLAYPGSLSLSVFPTDSASSGLRLEEAAPESIKAKADEAAKYLNGTAENCLPPVFLRPLKEATETCYEFDQEMILGKRDNQLYGTANGKSKLEGSTEACLVSFARSQIKEIENLIDMGLGLQQGMICQAVKDKVDVSEGQTEEGVELKDTLGTAMKAGSDPRKPKITVSEAMLSKDTNASGEDVYKVSIEISMSNDKGTFTQIYSLAHTPKDADNKTYAGVLTLTRKMTASALAGPGPGQDNKTHIISVSYSKGGDSGNILSAELRSARFAEALVTKAVDESGVLDYNAGANFTVDASSQQYGQYVNPTTSQAYQQANDAIGGMLLVGYNLNVDDNTGSFEYWQNPGGNYKEAARGMVFAIEKDANGLHGCGMSGAVLGTSNPMEALSIRRSVKEDVDLVPNGSFHPFFYSSNNQFTNLRETVANSLKTWYADENNNNTQDAAEKYWKAPSLTDTTLANTWAGSQNSSYVSRQCVRQDASSGEYRIDTTKITDAAGFTLFSPSGNTSFVIAKPKLPPPPPAPAK